MQILAYKHVNLLFEFGTVVEKEFGHVTRQM